MVREPVAVARAEAALPAQTPAPVAQSPAKPAAPPQTDPANPPSAPPIALADPVEAASGVKVARKAVNGAAPLIIDVQQALAEAKLRAALEARR